MTYAAPSDMIARYATRDLVQLVNEDPNAQDVDQNALQTFLNDASNEIDAYLESRFDLPLSDPPSILVRLCCELAMYHLHNLRPIHDGAWIKNIYEKNIKFLEAVRDRNVTLGLAADGQEPADPANPGVVQVDAGGGTTILPARIFSRGSLIGF